MTAPIVAIVAAVALAGGGGWWLTRRSGVFRTVHPEAEQRDAPDSPDTTCLDLSRTGPTVVHFSAPWCGPCDRVRRVVEQVCDALGGVAHVEVDMDADPLTARQFSVLSLPTTVIFDVAGRQRYRSSGIPKAADLRSVLQPLLA